MLPKAVIRAIQSVLCRFLWKGSSLAKSGSKVAWTTITLPTTEGGLGIKCLLDWNRSLILQHLLHVVQFTPHSLWASWIKTTILKDRSFWQIPIPTDCSWIWKQVLKLRPIALHHLSYNIGSGHNVYFWYDPWLNGSAINPSPSLISNSGIPNSAKVSYILVNSVWELPQSNHHDVIMLRRQLSSLSSPNSSMDTILWGTWDITKLKPKQIWESIRSRLPPVTWHKIIWNNLHVPRYSFIMWLGILKRLPTNDRTSLYSGNSWDCPLCQQEPETFDHLFFNCVFSSAIIRPVLSLGNFSNIPLQWEDLLEYLISFQGSKLTKNILCLSVAVCFYKVWEARNSKLHMHTSAPAPNIAADVIQLIKARLSTCKSFNRATNFCQYYCNWLMH